MKHYGRLIPAVGIALFGAVAATGFGALQAGQERMATPDPRVVAASADVRAVASANTAFTFSLLSQLSRARPEQNVFVSPYSISNALSMTLNGAGGMTRQGIAKALGLSALSTDAVNRGNGLLLPSLEDPDPKVKLSVANALWANAGVRFTLGFRQTCHAYYQADPTTLDLQGPSGAATINRWVSDKTEAKIDSIVSPEDLAGASAVLTNAVYFHGKWRDPFDLSATQPGPFQTDSGGPIDLPMMTQDVTVPYCETGAFQAVSLPYGNGRMSMVIILPKSPTGLQTVLRTLDGSTWAATVSGLHARHLTIFLPRFKLSYRSELSGPLSKLGMAQAFGGAADFGPMGLPSYSISAVLHKAVLEVDETGTTAAAATAVTFGAMAMPAPSIVVRVDHPFFCAIRDNLTGTILFAGAIYRPEKN